MPLHFPTVVCGYNTHQFPFAELVADILNVRRLAEAHALIDAVCPTREKDQQTKLHQAYYSHPRRLLHNSYRSFLSVMIAPILGVTTKLIYQRQPTFRAHVPHSMAVGEFHRDSQYAHSVHEINVWVPLTKAYATNTIWLESDDGVGDYLPYELDYGQMLFFCGGKLRHGNHVNETRHTRISFDFRVLLPDDYDPETAGRAINTNMALKVGDYFEELDLTEFQCNR